MSFFHVAYFNSIYDVSSGWRVDFPYSVAKSVAGAERGDSEALAFAYVIAEQCASWSRGTKTHLEGGLAVSISTC